MMTYNKKKTSLSPYEFSYKAINHHGSVFHTSMSNYTHTQRLESQAPKHRKQLKKQVRILLLATVTPKNK